MPTRLQSVKTSLRLRVYRALRGVADLLEPRDPGHLVSRIDHGDIVWRAFVEAGSALRVCGRFAEADAMVARGLAAFPGDATLLIEHAVSAHNSGRYALAIERWALALAAAPDDTRCQCGLAANLRETGQYERAAEVIERSLAAHPDDLIVISEAARLADARFQFERALDLWGRAIAQPSPHPHWLRGHANALVLLGRFEEAEVAIAKSRAEYPNEPALLAVEGFLASSREDWTRAVAVWTAYRERFPDDKTGWEHLGRAQERAALEEASATSAPQRAPVPSAPAAMAPPSVERTVDDTVRTLLLGFESIGDNCEFGSVQRRYGAEPLGLLRWNSVTLDGLLPALDQRLAGLGLPENTEMTLCGNGEYLVGDRRWGLAMHTFLFEGQTDRDALYAKMCRRVAFLRDKLLEDLASAEKIFVYRSAGIDGDALASLHKALCAFGPIRLLNVQPAAPTAPTSFQGQAGDVIQVDERRYVGFLEHLGVSDSGEWEIAFDDWVSVCRKTRAVATVG